MKYARQKRNLIRPRVKKKERERRSETESPLGELGGFFWGLLPIVLLKACLCLSLSLSLSPKAPNEALIYVVAVCLFRHKEKGKSKFIWHYKMAKGILNYLRPRPLFPPLIQLRAPNKCMDVVAWKPNYSHQTYSRKPQTFRVRACWFISERSACVRASAKCCLMSVSARARVALRFLLLVP